MSGFPRDMAVGPSQRLGEGPVFLFAHRGRPGPDEEPIPERRDGARSALELAAWQLASIIENADDAIVSKDLNGTILSWNRGAERLFGYADHEVVGGSITVIVPPDRLDEEKDILERLRRGERIEHFETLRRRKDGSFVEISLTVSPVRDDEGKIVGASKIARDISQRKRTEERLRKQTQRLEILNRISKTISQDLDLGRIVQAVTDIGTELSGARLGAFFYKVIDQSGETNMLYALSGALREGFDRLGLARNSPVFNPSFSGTEVVRSDDIRADPRYGTLALHPGMPAGHPPVVSYLAVPVITRAGAVAGGLFFGHDQPGVFQQDTEEIVVGIAAHAAIAIENARLHQAVQQELRDAGAPKKPVDCC